MPKIKKALEQFRNPYSCAQTVYVAFKHTDEEKLAHLKKNSGGQAPENMCGALYAAIELLPENMRESAIAEFTQQAGSTKCIELKTKYKTPCQECVRIASTIVNENLKSC